MRQTSLTPQRSSPLSRTATRYESTSGRSTAGYSWTTSSVGFYAAMVRDPDYRRRRIRVAVRYAHRAVFWGGRRASLRTPVPRRVVAPEQVLVTVVSNNAYSPGVAPGPACVHVLTRACCGCICWAYRERIVRYRQGFSVERAGSSSVPWRCGCCNRLGTSRWIGSSPCAGDIALGSSLRKRGARRSTWHVRALTFDQAYEFLVGEEWVGFGGIRDRY